MAMKASDSALISKKLYSLGADVWIPYHQNLSDAVEFTQKDGWYALRCIKGKWWLFLRKGFRWNGANCYPDWDFILIPSAKHDVGHWLIEHGAFPESYNNLIDKELQLDIKYSKTPVPFIQGGWIPKPIRAKYIQRATNIANSTRRPSVLEDQFKYRRVSL